MPSSWRHPTDVHSIRVTPSLRSFLNYITVSWCSLFSFSSRQIWQNFRTTSCFVWRREKCANLTTWGYIGTLIELTATCVLLFYSPWSTQSIIGVETGCRPAGLVERLKTIRDSEREREFFFMTLFLFLLIVFSTVYAHLSSIESICFWSFDLKVKGTSIPYLILTIYQLDHQN